MICFYYFCFVYDIAVNYASLSNSTPPHTSSYSNYLPAQTMSSHLILTQSTNDASGTPFMSVRASITTKVMTHTVNTESSTDYTKRVGFTTSISNIIEVTSSDMATPMETIGSDSAASK